MELKPLYQLTALGYNTKVDLSLLRICKGSNRSFNYLNTYPTLNSLVAARIVDKTILANRDCFAYIIGKVSSMNHGICKIKAQYKLIDIGSSKGIWEDIEISWMNLYPILIKPYTLEALGFEPYDIRGFKGYRLRTFSGFLKVRKQSSYWDDDKVDDPVWEFVYGNIIYPGKYLHELIDFIKHLGINIK